VHIAIKKRVFIILLNAGFTLFIIEIVGKNTKKMSKNMVCIRKSAIFAAEIAGERFE
jgi:hypothetical protein